MMELIDEFNHLLGPLISLGVTIGVLVPGFRWIKKQLTDGYVSLEDMENHDSGLKKHIESEIEALKEYMAERDDMDKKWLNTLQEKVENNGKEVAAANAKLELLSKS